MAVPIQIDHRVGNLFVEQVKEPRLIGELPVVHVGVVDALAKQGVTVMVRARSRPSSCCKSLGISTPAHSLVLQGAGTPGGPARFPGSSSTSTRRTMPKTDSGASALAPLPDGSSAGELLPEIVRHGLQQLIELEVAAVWTRPSTAS